MKHRIALASTLALALALALTAPSVSAEEENGKSMMEQGLELFMEGLRQEMAPAVEDLRDLADRVGPAMGSFLKEMGPALAEMMDEVQDWTRYDPPEMLPNGDIIIRRRPDPEPAPEPDPGQDMPAPSGPTDI